MNSMEHSVPVSSPVSVGTDEVSLSLDQGRGKSLCPPLVLPSVVDMMLIASRLVWRWRMVTRT